MANMRVMGHVGRNGHIDGTKDKNRSTNLSPSSCVCVPSCVPYCLSRSLKLLHLRYDVTPIKYVSSVITEVGIIPPTAVPALLREYRHELGDIHSTELF